MAFWPTRDAADDLVPRVSLDELYDERVADWLRERGAVIHLETPVAEVVGDELNESAACGWPTAASGRSTLSILAVPWRRVGELLPPAIASRRRSAPAIRCHRVRPDQRRPPVVRSADHRAAARRARRPAVAVGLCAARAHHSPMHRSRALLPGRHQRLARSGGPRAAGDRGRSARRSAGRLSRGGGRAACVRWQLVTEHDAVFSVRPGLDAIRPRQQTAIPNLLLAGDWTAHRLARDDGRGRPQRLPGRRSRSVTTRPPRADRRARSAARLARAAAIGLTAGSQHRHDRHPSPLPERGES